ncbi:MAG: metallophosphoesterase [Gammaproteobacteria bacterium]
MAKIIMRCVLLSVLLLAAQFSHAATQDWRWEDVERVVAVGDVHGAYDQLTGILKQAGIIDDQLRWTGGKTHLVSVGDLVDRGARSREVIELFMALQPQAAAAGGQIHVLLGNHDAMQVSGELEYVSVEEFASYIDVEDPARRQAAYQRFLAYENLADGDVARAAFEQKFPPGYFGHQAFFAADGRYGAWTLDRPVAIVVNGMLFVHGGVSDDLAGGDLATINRQLSADLARYASAWTTLRDAGVLNETTPFSARPALAAETTDPDLLAAASELGSASESPVFTADGPLWFRGTAWCNENFEVFRVNRVLEAQDAQRAVLGHTPTPDSRVVSRMNDAVLLIDTGMLVPVYHGRAAALLEQEHALTVLYPEQESPQAIHPEPRRVGDRPDRLTDQQLEDILSNGEIVSIEEVGEGVTKPRKVRLRSGGIEIDAVFKTESTNIVASRRSQQAKLINLSDRWQHEVAAYRLDRLIDLQMVPVTVEREINGTPGSLQYWVPDMINELKREQESLAATGWCPLGEQWPLMFIFDALIYNEDRTKQNITYASDDWMLYLIDHSRAFRTLKGRPQDLRKVDLKVSGLLAERLANLDYAQLSGTLGSLLEKAQIQAVLKRRDQILQQSVGRP